jgi:hypothetical protein
LNFVCKRLEGATLVRGGEGPVFLKLDNRLKAEGSGSDLRLEDPDEIGSGGFCEVNDDRLQSDGSVYLLTDSFSEREADKTFF